MNVGHNLTPGGWETTIKGLMKLDIDRYLAKYGDKESRDAKVNWEDVKKRFDTMEKVESLIKRIGKLENWIDQARYNIEKNKIMVRLFDRAYGIQPSEDYTKSLSEARKIGMVPREVFAWRIIDENQKDANDNLIRNMTGNVLTLPVVEIIKYGEIEKYLYGGDIRYEEWPPFESATKEQKKVMKKALKSKGWEFSNSYFKDSGEYGFPLKQVGYTRSEPIPEYGEEGYQTLARQQFISPNKRNLHRQRILDTQRKLDGYIAKRDKAIGEYKAGEMISVATDSNAV